MRKIPQHQDQMINKKRWFAVYTYFRREKSAISALEKLGIECFIPLMNKTKKYDRKIKHYSVPLINHYIFVKVSEVDFNTVLGSRDVIRFIKFGSKPSPIPDSEINILKRICGEHSILDIEALQPSKIGQEVEVISGNLVGLKGRLVQIRNNKQVLIDLNHIGYSIRLEIGISALSCIHQSALQY